MLVVVGKRAALHGMHHASHAMRAILSIVHHATAPKRACDAALSVSYTVHVSCGVGEQRSEPRAVQSCRDRRPCDVSAD
eukprot:7114044-Prymnesium_polylepis.1